MRQYRYIRSLDRRGKVTMVCDGNDTLHIRKRLTPEELVIYRRLYDIRPKGVPAIKEIYSEDGTDYLIEEYIDGQTIAELIDGGRRFSVKEAAGIAKSLCRTLAPIHRRGIVHRDITASNVMLSYTGSVYLIDFGNSRIHKQNRSKDTEFVGTQGYAAPEQFGFGQSDKRTDIYAIGVLMNVMLTGSFPYEEKYKGSPAKVIRKCTAVKPKDRYRSVGALRRAILRAKYPLLFSRPAWIAYTLAAVVLFCILAATAPDNNTDSTELLEITTIERAAGTEAPAVRKETAESLIRAGKYEEARSYLDSVGVRGYLEVMLYSQSYEAQNRYDDAVNVLIDYMNEMEAAGYTGTSLLRHKNSFTPWFAKLYPNCSDEVKRRIDALPTPEPD